VAWIVAWSLLGCSGEAVVVAKRDFAEQPLPSSPAPLPPGSGGPARPTTVPSREPFSVVGDTYCVGADCICANGSHVRLEAGAAISDECIVCSVSSSGLVRCGSVQYAAREFGRLFVSPLRYRGCVLSARGRLDCWKGGGTARVEPDPLAPSSQVQLVSVGNGHACAVDLMGLVYCWGDNTEGAVSGAGSARYVTGLTGVTSVDVGDFSSCAVGELYGEPGTHCWGRLGDLQTLVTAPASSEERRPRTLEGSERSVRVTVGLNSVCSLNVDGGVRCWGESGGWAGRLVAFGQVAVDGGLYPCFLGTANDVGCWVPTHERTDLFGVQRVW